MAQGSTKMFTEALIPRKLVERYLHTTPEKIAELNLRKNWVGTSLAGGLRSANAHFANMLLAFYLATGQDAANIVEGSQGFTLAVDTPEAFRRFVEADIAKWAKVIQTTGATAQ